MGHDDFDSAEYLTKALPQNVDEFTLKRNQKYNRRAFSPLESVWVGIDEVAILGGGPSLKKFWGKIKALKDGGAAIVTMNGSLMASMGQNMWPVFQVIVDAREENARFTRPVIPGTVYLIADTVSPKILKGLPHAQVRLWDRAAIKGGSTVLLCAIPLLKSIGAKRIHVFGGDSCLDGTEHHAYHQPENDHEDIVNVPVHGRTFRCAPWMVQQAEEFLELCPSWGGVTIYGDGLISHLLRHN